MLKYGKPFDPEYKLKLTQHSLSTQGLTETLARRIFTILNDCSRIKQQAHLNIIGVVLDMIYRFKIEECRQKHERQKNIFPRFEIVNKHTIKANWHDSRFF